MVRDDGLNPGKLKTAIGKKPIYAIEDVIKVLAAANVPTKKLRESVIESTGMSRSMFYELLAKLKDTPGVAFDEEKQIWSYRNPHAATLN